MELDEDAEKIIQQILDETDAEREEIEEKIEEKQDELSGFITPEGAATIVARSYGITPEREEPEVRKLLIEDLSDGMSNIDVVGVVERTFEPREFEKKDGSEGKVSNVILKDKTGEVRTVLWGEMTKLVTEEEIQRGTILHVKGAYVKKGRDGSPELNIGRRSDIEIEPTDERVDDLPSMSETFVKISDLEPDLQYADIVGRVTAASEPREFERSDGSSGKVSNLRLIDETGKTRVALWGDKAEKTEEIEQGDAVKIENASVREGQQGDTELHLNWRGKITKNLSPSEVENLPEFEKKLLKVEEVEPDMSAFEIAARVQRTYSVKNFTRDDGSEGRVMGAVLGDETGTIRASFWDEKVDVGEKLSRGDLILIENARSKIGLRDRPEIQVGGQARVKINPEDIEIEKTEPKTVKLSELEEGMNSIETVGRVIEISDVREFERQDGSEGKAATLTVGDETGKRKVTLWDSKTKIIDELDVGDIIRITNSYTVSGSYGDIEIHLGEDAEVEVGPETVTDIPAPEEIKEKTSPKSRSDIEDVEENTQAKIYGTVVQVFQRNPVFRVCPKCNKNIKSEDSQVLCDKCGETVAPEPRAVVNMIVDDGTGNIRVVAFGKQAEELIGKTANEVYQELRDEDLSDLYEELDLEGQDIDVSGNVRRDEYYEQLELRTNEVNFPKAKNELNRMLERIEA